MSHANKQTAETHCLSQLIGTVQPIRLFSDQLPGNLQLDPDPRIQYLYIARVANQYGVTRLLVTPDPATGGTGEAWINANKLMTVYPESTDGE